MTKARPAWLTQGLRLLALLVLCAVALQLVFAARIAMMLVIDPQSTTFQRSEVARLLVEQHRVAWTQDWVPAERMSPNLKRAVIASEDATFTTHGGVDWKALREASKKNERAEQRAEKQQQRQPDRNVVAKVIGGSTITQQLAKNLFLSGERTVFRKGQELVLTLLLEVLLPKQRILEIYLNNVEWGEGVFGAQAASRYYFRVDAARLAPEQAARLAVMLPAPKRFEKRPASAYVVGRASTIVARMGGVALP